MKISLLTYKHLNEVLPNEKSKEKGKCKQLQKDVRSSLGCSSTEWHTFYIL